MTELFVEIETTDFVLQMSKKKQNENTGHKDLRLRPIRQAGPGTKEKKVAVLNPNPPGLTPLWLRW